jgi:hypothetical protein
MGKAEDRNKRRRTGFALAPSLLAGLLFIAALTPGPVLAQADVGKAPLRSNRCLLVVETSRAMQRQSEAVRQIVQDMLRSGFGGQLRGGDTLGVWTYNDRLYAGRFHLQTWSPEAQKDITQRVLTFLKDQKYEQQASFDKVLPALGRLVKDSPLITVILISSPDEKLRRTRYDYPINQAYENRKWREEQEKALMPLVTVLRAQDGQFGDYTANTPQERQRAETIQTKLLKAMRNAPLTVAPRVVLPAQERQLTEAVQAKLLEAVRNASLTNAAPVILPWKTTRLEKAPAPKPQPAGVNVQPPVPAPEAAIANKPLTVKPPVPAAQPVQIAKAEAAPVVPDKPSLDLPPKPAPAAKPVTEPKVEVAKATEVKPTMPALPTPEIASALPARAPEPKPAAPELPKPAPAPEVKPAPAPKPVTEPEAEVAKAPETKPAAPASSKTEAAPAPSTPAPNPAPAAPAAREVSSGTIPNATAPASAPPDSSTLSPRPSPLPVPPVQTATAIPAETLARNRSIWIAGLVLAGAAISLALLLLRRSRATAGGSLITQSFERKHKP